MLYAECGLFYLIFKVGLSNFTAFLHWEDGHSPFNFAINHCYVGGCSWFSGLEFIGPSLQIEFFRLAASAHCG